MELKCLLVMVLDMNSEGTVFGNVVCGWGCRLLIACFLSMKGIWILDFNF